MKTQAAILLTLVLVCSAWGQCSTIQLSDTTSHMIVVDPVPDGGVEHFFYYPYHNDSDADEAVQLRLTLLAGPAPPGWTYSMCRGDEFCILLPETDGDGAGYVLRRLEGQVQSGELWGGDLAPTPEVEIAVTSMPKTGVKTGDDLLKKTRHALSRDG